MAVRFAMLASGSSGNAALVEADGFGLLIDAGLGPRQIAARLASAGSSWAKVSAVILTHTHSDHWNNRTLKHVRQHRIPFYCHPSHHAALKESSSSFCELIAANLVRCYDGDQELRLSSTLRCQPLEVRHDSDSTFGFRIEGHNSLFGPSWAVGYAADLGSWSVELADRLANADILALEFNHDEQMERTSRRPVELVERVLSDVGHLSNLQAAEFLRAILRRSEPGVTRHVIQLHLSRECNRPALAESAAREALTAHGPIAIHTTDQNRVGPVLTLDGAPRRPRRAAVAKAIPQVMQQLLPGMAE